MPEIPNHKAWGGDYIPPTGPTTIVVNEATKGNKRPLGFAPWPEPAPKRKRTAKPKPAPDA